MRFRNGAGRGTRPIRNRSGEPLSITQARSGCVRDGNAENCAGPKVRKVKPKTKRPESGVGAGTITGRPSTSGIRPRRSECVEPEQPER